MLSPPDLSAYPDLGLTTPTSSEDGSEGKEILCRVAARLPSIHGTFRLHLYRDPEAPEGTADHLAIVYGEDIHSASLLLDQPGDTPFLREARGATAAAAMAARTPPSPEAPLVRIHSECLTGEVLGSERCDCGEQLATAMDALEARGRGVIVYLRQEGRGIGLLEKLRAYNLQDGGMDTVAANIALGHPADGRQYQIASAILRDLGINGQGITLLTNNPDKMEQLRRDGVLINDRRPMIPQSWSVPASGVDTPTEKDAYLLTKVHRMRHLLDLPKALENALSKPTTP